METTPFWRKLFNRLFVPPGDEGQKAFRDILPFFVLVTLVIVWVYIEGVRSTQLVERPWRLVGFTILVITHLALYWLTIFFAASRRRTFNYLFVQGILIFAIVLITRSEIMVMSLFASVIGNAVGMLGKQKATLAAAGYYLALAVFSLTFVAVAPDITGLLYILFPVIAFSIFFAYFFNQQIEARQQTQELLEELEQAHRQLSEYTIQVEDLTLAGERQRMARELHDTLAQGLAGLILQLEAVAIHIEGGSTAKAREIVEQAMVKARATLVDARKAIDDLRADLEDPQVLKQLIRREVERFQGATGIDCRIEISLPPEVSAKLGEHILRTVSEGLWNIARHAQASQAGVRILTAEDTVILTIEDNGVGFDPEEQVGRGGHYGLLGIRERARLAGGTFSVESLPGDGTTLRVSLPVTTMKETS